MDRNNKYYEIIRNLVTNHRKFPGCEAIIEEIIDDVYKHSEVIMRSVTNEDVINSYLEKVISTSIITVPKKMGFNKSIRHAVIRNTVQPKPTANEIQSDNSNVNVTRANKDYVDRMINSAEGSNTITNNVEQQEISENQTDFDSVKVTEFSDELTSFDSEELNISEPGFDIEEINDIVPENSEYLTEEDSSFENKVLDTEINQENEIKEYETFEILTSDNTDIIDNTEDIQILEEPEQSEPEPKEMDSFDISKEDEYYEEITIEPENETTLLAPEYNVEPADEDETTLLAAEDKIESADEDETTLLAPEDNIEPAVETEDLLSNIEGDNTNEPYDTTSDLIEEDVNYAEEEFKTIDEDSVDILQEDTSENIIPDIMQSDINNDTEILELSEDSETFEENYDIKQQDEISLNVDETDADNTLSNIEQIEEIEEPSEDSVEENSFETINLEGPSNDNDFLVESGNDDGILISEDNQNDLIMQDSLDEFSDLGINTNIDFNEQDNDIITLEENPKEEVTQPIKIQKTDYSIFSFTNEQDDYEDKSVDEISAGLKNLNIKYPNLNIIQIFELKYKKNRDIESIAQELNMSKEDVLSSLAKIIDLV